MCKWAVVLLFQKKASAHENFKQHCLNLQEGDTFLTAEKVIAVRLVKNEFYESVENAQQRGASIDELRELLGRGRAKKGIFEGDLQNGELEIGQVSATISNEQRAAEIIDDMISVYRDTLKMRSEKFSILKKNNYSFRLRMRVLSMLGVALRDSVVT